jgi:WD40 repeat protein
VLPIGHTDDIERVVISSDQKLLLTKSKDNTCKLFDFQSGFELYSFQNSNGNTLEVRFSPKSNYLIIETEEKTQVIDLNSFSRKLEIEKLFNARIDEKEEFIIGCNDYEAVSIYQISDGKLISTSDEIWGLQNVEFIKESKSLLAITSDNELVFIDNKRLKEVGKRIAVKNDIESYEFSSNGKYIALEEEDGVFEVYDVIERKRLGYFTNPANRFQLLKFSNDCKSIVTCSDTVVRIFGLFPFEEKCSFVVPAYQLSDIFFSLDGSNIIATDWDGKIKVYSSTNGEFKKECTVINEIILDAAIDSSGKNIITANNDNSLSRFNIEHNRLIYNSKGAALKVSNTKFVSNSSFIAFAASDTMHSVAKLFDARTGLQASLYDDYGEELHYHDLLNEDKIDPLKHIRLVSLNDNSFGYTYNSGIARRILKKFIGHNNPVRFLSFNFDKTRIVSGSKDGVIKVWDAESGKNEITINIENENLESVRFNSSGTRLITASDGKVRVWDSKSGEAISEFNYSSRIRDAGYSWNDDLVYGVCGNGFDRDSVVIFNIASKKVITLSRGHGKEILSVSFSSDGKFIVTTGADHKTILWDVESGKILYTRLQLENNDWLIYDEDYRFDGSAGAIEKLYFTCGLEIIELGQMKDALYVPGLAEKIVNGEDINYPKLSEIDICGALPIIEKTEENEGGWKFQLEQRRWPVVRIDVKVDGKTVKSIPSNQLQFENGIVEISLSLSEMQHFFVGGKENVISISAVTSQNGSEIKSRGIDVLFFAEEPKDPPRMFMLMIGVSDYKDDALDLVFPAHDARSLGNALELSANKLLGEANVEMYHVQSKTKENTVFTTPEREGVMKALADIGSKAKANDVLFIFFAGHGVMQGQSDKSFTFLTADASQINQIGISTTDLISWLSPEGPFKMLPNKTILVYDACNSGQAAKELMAVLARSDDDTERLRQIEELGDKSGLFILSASAPNKPAYELPQLGQGLLTYSLLYTLKNNPNIIDQGQDGKGYLNLQKWFLESEREQNQRVLSLGLKQEAQPYGTGNIKLGVVDDEVRNAIQLMDEKSLVFCGNARDENDEDPLELKRSVNDYFENALVRGLPSSLAFVAAETPNANVIKLIYNIEENQVTCRVLFFKNKIKMKEISINSSSENILNKLVESITSTLEN